MRLRRGCGEIELDSERVSWIPMGLLVAHNNAMVHTR